MQNLLSFMSTSHSRVSNDVHTIDWTATWAKILSFNLKMFQILRYVKENTSGQASETHIQTHIIATKSPILSNTNGLLMANVISWNDFRKTFVRSIWSSDQDFSLFLAIFRLTMFALGFFLSKRLTMFKYCFVFKNTK